MKAVPLISNKIRERSLSGSRLKKKAKDYAGYSAVLAVIGQAALPYGGETEAPKEVQKWQAYCMQMRTRRGGPGRRHPGSARARRPSRPSAR